MHPRQNTLQTLICIALVIFGVSACSNDDNSTQNNAQSSAMDATVSLDASNLPMADADTQLDATRHADVLDSFTPVDAGPEGRDSSMALVDMDIVDAMLPIDMMLPPSRVECDLNVELNTPAVSSFVHIDQDITFSGTVTAADGQPVNAAEVHLIDDRERFLGQGVTNDSGTFEITLTAAELGQRLLSAEPVVILESGFCGPATPRKVYRCLQTFREDFDTAPQNWVMHGDARWNGDGYLEMTGTQSGRKGAVYNNVDAISSGLASIEFVMSTGGGINGGADGFALTIIDIENATELNNLITQAASGGGLGYAVAPEFGRNDFEWVGEALTVEIDTWYNDFSNRGEGLGDPTQQNHIALTRNANPGDHIVWHAVPNVEDLVPHTVRVDLIGNTIRISYDGVVVIEEPIQFAFKGGYMFFSGSTGWATNYHRFHNLDILSNCF